MDSPWGQTGSILELLEFATILMRRPRENRGESRNKSKNREVNG